MLSTQPGIFVGAKIAAESRALIRNYVALLDLPPDIKPLPVEEYHVTVIYSRVPLPVVYPLDKSSCQATVYDVRYIGKAVALIMESSWLRWRVGLAKICGYRSDFSGFIPHLSILYDPPPGLPVAFWPKPNFSINLAGEYQETLRD